MNLISAHTIAARYACWAGRSRRTRRLCPRRAPQTRQKRGGPKATLQGYGFLLPALALLRLFHLLPVFYALFLSLFDARVFRDMWRPGAFAGAGNYTRLLTSADFGQSLANTVWFVAITVPGGLCLAVVFAQLLNARIWGRTGYRVTYFCRGGD